MPGFHGELLIGGMTLHEVAGELAEEEPERDSHDWRLAGHLRLSPQHELLLQLDRDYLLQLADGRAGHVVITRLAPEPDQLLAEFKPRAKAK